jgi:hypothetical protein
LQAIGTVIAGWTLALCVPLASLAQETPPAEAGDGALNFWQRLRSHTYVSGTVKSESALELNGGDAQKWETILQPDFEMQIGQDWDLTMIPRLRFDPVDRLYPGSPHQPERAGPDRAALLGEPLELELRELYVRTQAGSTYLTLGKQQVVWGKADGLKVLDVVNPQDYREFVLDEFDDSRIPLWMVNAEIPVKSATLQLLWIPDLTYHDLPEPGSPFEFTSQVPQTPPGVNVVQREPDRPNNPLLDGDLGFRLSSFWKGWDLTFNYLYFYDDFPALYRDIDLTGPTPVVTSRPAYERAHLIGATFSNAFGKLTVRGEAGYTIGRYFPTQDVNDADGVDKSGELAYVAGLDWFGFGDTVLSFQFFQSILTDGGRGLLRDDVENMVSFLAQRDFLNDSLVLSTIWVHNLNDNDGFVRPKLKYELGTGMDVWAGVDVFYGTKRGLFGEFNDASRVVFGFEYSFGS